MPQGVHVDVLSLPKGLQTNALLKFLEDLPVHPWHFHNHLPESTHLIDEVIQVFVLPSVSQKHRFVKVKVQKAASPKHCWRHLGKKPN